MRKKWRKRWCHESDPWEMMIGDERSEYSIKRIKGGQPDRTNVEIGNKRIKLKYMEKFVSQILEKISNYQFLNNLILGALFCVILPLLTRYDLMGDNMWFNLAIVYFSGIVMSRFVSIVIEELFKKWHIVTFESYPRYIDASAKDEFIKTLSMENNMYRTFISLFVLLLLSKLSDWLASVWVFLG